MDPLKEKLEAWQVEPRIGPGFNREVWSRIAAKESSRWQSHWPSLIVALFSRPRYATALVIVSLSASLGAAHLRSRSENLQHWSMLEERYMQSIDSLANTVTRR